VAENSVPRARATLPRVESYDLDQYEEDLTLFLHAWPDIEAVLLEEANEDRYNAERARALADAVRRAFRVEVQTTPSTFGRGLGYVLFFDVNSQAARRAAAVVNDKSSTINLLVYKYAPIQGEPGTSMFGSYRSVSQSRARSARG
jgi:hypothetical protein